MQANTYGLARPGLWWPGLARLVGLGQAVHITTFEYPLNLYDFIRKATKSNSRISKTRWINIDVVNLARMEDMPWLLPTALYLICSLAKDANAIVKGISRDDKNITLNLPSDTIICLAARESLAKLQATTVFAWTDNKTSISGS